MSGATLITGATGFIGLQIADLLLGRGEEVVVVVRAPDDDAARGRIIAALKMLHDRVPSGYQGLLTAVAGDITLPKLGLDTGNWQMVLSRCERIVHSAAAIEFTLELEHARSINLAGTKNIAELASALHASGNLRKYVHVSTAYVCGDHAGSFCEDQLDVGQEFSNSYEQSKLESEQFVSRLPDDLPRAVVRPSVVVGEWQSGWTSAFNVLYWPLRAFTKGWIPYIPVADDEPRLDVVTVDYVAAATCEILLRDDALGTFHLTSGPRTLSLAKLARVAAELSSTPPARFVSPGEMARLLPGLGNAQIQTLQNLAVFQPYMASKAKFNDRRTRQLLATLIEPRRLEPALGRLVGFALSSRWGKRPVTRQQARARTAKIAA